MAIRCAGRGEDASGVQRLEVGGGAPAMWTPGDAEAENRRRCGSMASVLSVSSVGETGKADHGRGVCASVGYSNAGHE